MHQHSAKGEGLSFSTRSLVQVGCWHSRAIPSRKPATAAQGSLIPPLLPTNKGSDGSSHWKTSAGATVLILPYVCMSARKVSLCRVFLKLI